MGVLEERSSRVQDAYEHLLSEISSFRLRTGAPLSENRIATELGISRTPVREALRLLEKEGLVKRSDNARYAVSQLTMQEANDACDLLEVLDAYIARQAARKMTEEQAAQLREYVEQMRAAAGAGDTNAWAAADAKFHRALNAMAGNELVSNTVKETRRRIQRFWLRAATLHHRLESCSDEHAVLVEAILDKDYDAIERAVSLHIGHMRERVLNLLEGAALFIGE